MILYSMFSAYKRSYLSGVMEDINKYEHDMITIILDYMHAIAGDSDI